MKRHGRVLSVGLGVLLGALLLSGCKGNDKADFFLPKTYGDHMPPTGGSLDEMNRKKAQKARKAADARQKEALKSLGMVTLMVAHDAKGKPVGVEVRHSSGDSELDGQARDLVMKKWRFPAGHADTVVVEVDPKSLPKSAVK